MNRQPIAFFIPTLAGGGAERVVINLLKGMLERDIPLDLVLVSATGLYLSQMPKQVRLFDLKSGRVLKAILPLSQYLRQNKPRGLISHISHANVVALLARDLARTNTPLIVVEHNNLSAFKSNLTRAKFLPPFMKWLYPHVEAIVGVSQGVVDDLEILFGFGKEKVSLIYNPVIDNELIAKAKAPLVHPWFQKGSPLVFLAVGRLTEQKDFLTLIKAFAILRKQVVARLVILGEGELRTELEATINALGITKDVSLPGFVENPYAYMSNASAFVLSSRWEGLPTVLIEAMACGCPVIATDCPSGPKEILEDGKYGSLVPMGDAESLSRAMLQILETSVNRDILVQRAMHFSREESVSKYLDLLVDR
ncbi:glycosyltransferase [Cylindrospermum stagnale PCC 7417]|uniref:Glycosyltransferase n=1 Tax=Cylindrospermum stagnale PCC 7417 TaxID=56107 RepID=K9X3L1_9NOST|nr:glycosyltransferase [Cylindrospermum stagnale]AFZ26292.1 glycosyltransferase [Cylindrospermum stagnale PCC 7417]